MDRSKVLKLLTVLGLVACLTGFASDIYAPSFLTMASQLKATVPGIQRTMSIFMLAVALTQLLYGSLSEVFGRRMPLLGGLCVMMAGSLLCAGADSLTTLMLGRFVQGAGAGACACLWRSIFRDIFNAQQMAKYGGYLGIVMVYVVAAAPFLGGHLEEYPGWRASFVAVFMYALIVFLGVCFILPETNIHRSKERFSMEFFVGACKQLLTSPLFMGYCLCVFFTYGALFSWFVVGPVVCAVYFEVSPVDFGSLNLVLGGTAMAVGGIFNGRYVGRLGQTAMLRLGWSIVILSGLLIIVLDLVYGKALLPFWVCIFMFLFGVTLIWPNAFARAFAPFGAIAGYAGGVYSAMQLGGGAVLGWASSFLPCHKPYPLALVFIASALSAWWVFEKQNKLTAS